jgi:hypothetical protein
VPQRRPEHKPSKTCRTVPEKLMDPYYTTLRNDCRSVHVIAGWSQPSTSLISRRRCPRQSPDQVRGGHDESNIASIDITERSHQKRPQNHFCIRNRSRKAQIPGKCRHRLPRTGPQGGKLVVDTRTAESFVVETRTGEGFVVTAAAEGCRVGRKAVACRAGLEVPCPVARGVACLAAPTAPCSAVPATRSKAGSRFPAADCNLAPCIFELMQAH